MNNKFINMRILLLSVLLTISGTVFSQNTENAKPVNTFKSSVSITNNGISLIPTFTLGEPAAIFDMSVGRRLSFDPQFRFSLEGKPWSFIFWWRYKLLQSEKFQLNVGAHPAVLFSNTTAIVDDVSKELTTVRRFLVGELAPTYVISDNVSVGMYYLYSRGQAKDGLKNTHFLTARAFTNFKISPKLTFHINPQLYYLKMDEKDGYYLTSTFKLSKKDSPLSVSSVINQTIDANIAGDDFVWNVSLTYSFNKKYIEL